MITDCTIVRRRLNMPGLPVLVRVRVRVRCREALAVNIKSPMPLVYRPY